VGDKPIWMTEWAQRYRHGDLDSALEYGRNILNALRLGAEAWMVFEWMHSYGNQSGLISTDWGEQRGERRYWRSKAYHVFRQSANTTPVGSSVVAMTPTTGAGELEYLALASATNVVVHLVNSGHTTVTTTLHLRDIGGTPPAVWRTSFSTDVEPLDPLSCWETTSPGGEVAVRGGSITVPQYSLTTLVFARQAAMSSR
jgi:hypothetical protein